MIDATKRIQARVFISCGQQRNTDELMIAQRVFDKLGEMHFDPYIAVGEQTLKGLKENIFQRLGESEYFLFIDFRREKLNADSTDMPSFHRGSLFSHQELSIAAYLDIEPLIFQEEGVKQDDGILKFIQANCIRFTDRHLLPDVIAERVRAQWDPTWRNELLLERVGRQEDVYHSPAKSMARFCHIKVRNLHRRKMARQCVAYLERVRDFSSGDSTIMEPVELKWKGVTIPQVSIAPASHRYLDSFYVFHATPHIAQIGLNPFIIDFTGYHRLYEMKGPNTFELDYVVFSENFCPARATFRLQIGNKLDEIQFGPISFG
ncbi:MAG: hypothetical protein IBX68_03230 [Dehalococcoidia bacterium]|nr:hypothetical protein [Dehalococcoidia bacterium]